ncbi:ribosome hibernation-promoting factor, HPF/YfiA family [Scatolibacter rhodanostii]|uniref:ribosome hibernation-promoting factor, HPF/YfiA family n=1 Tax=Scatolibacter rhodanostii TaxID=2014781 RepID=UPI000C07BC05|nr:ribosome-associated translation inhibitor RaiA [Scatolibacter rhodanostii]
MKINFVGKKVTLRDHFKDLATKKISKFDKIFDEDAQATVIVTVEKNRQTVEISIAQRGMIYRAESTEIEMNDALDRVVSALATQIHRNRKKLQRAKKVQENVDFNFLDHEDSEDEELGSVVRTKEFFVKVMTPEEAILQMDMLNHEFFMFREDTTGDINVVYRRKDGNYGLLVPER